MPKVTLLGRVCPVRVRLCTNCLSVVYVVKRMAELAPCRIICGSAAQRHARTGGEDEDETYDGKESAINTPEALFPHDGHRAVHEAAEARLRELGVADQFGSARCITHLGGLEVGDGETGTYLIVSEGVTAKMASITPAPNPARRLRGALTFPLMPQTVNSIKGERARCSHLCLLVLA